MFCHERQVISHLFREFVMKIRSMGALAVFCLFAGPLIADEAGLLSGLKQDIVFLSSETCMGRSYHAGGIRRAERYIAAELRKAGIRVKKQSLRYDINISTKTPLCVVDSDTLTIAYDYIPHPYSASFSAYYPREQTLIYDTGTLEKIKDSLEFNSLSVTRRYLMEEHANNEDKRLLLFPEEDILQSKQDKQFSIAGLQIREALLDPDFEGIYAENHTRLKKLRSNNVVGLIPGPDKSDSLIIFTAHYDHMGALGDIWYPGANDNASGVAVLLALARRYAEETPPCSLLFCFVSGEEQGLLGSKRHAESPIYDMEHVMSLINLDMVASGGKGYGMVNGSACPKEAAILQDICNIYEFGECRIRDNSPNSDHYPFTQIGIRAFFLYTSGGEQPYHHPEDVAETLDWEVLEQTVMLMREFIERRAGNSAAMDQGFSR